MLLSELIEPKQDGLISAYGVKVDVESFTPPPGLQEISLIYKADGNDIDENLMDVIISYGIAGVEIILEIPAEEDGIDPEYMVSIAANAGFSLSLLPPIDDNPASRQQYFDRLTAFASVYLSKSNFGKFIAPVTNYLEYLFVEMLVGSEAPFNVTDPYIQERLSKLADDEFVTAFKDSLRQDFYHLFGGKDQFERFSRRMMSEIHGFAGECVTDLIGERARSSWVFQ